MEFPREGLCDRSNNFIAGDSIPTDLIDATCEMALYAKQSKNLNVESGIKSKSLGVASVTYGDTSKNDPYKPVSQYLSPYIKSGFQVDRV